MNITNVINKTAQECGAKVIFARVEESKLILDTIREFPIIIRTFAESITEVKNGRKKRTCMFYFCNSVSAKADTATKIAPVVDDMEQLADNFFKKLRSQGVEVAQLGGYKPQVSRLKNNEAGILATVDLTYNSCNG